MKATIPLVARKGRASYLGERSAGHQDPGATSTYLLLKRAAETLGAAATRRPRRRRADVAKYVGALDQGTTSTRFMIFDHGGNVVDFAQKEHEQIYPKPGWVEHDAKEIWERTQEVIDEGARQGRRKRRRHLAAVGITNQRETTVVWDRNTGEPVHNAIVWQDTRTDKIVDELSARRRPGSLPASRPDCRSPRTSRARRSSGCSTTSTAPASRPMPATCCSATSTPGASGTSPAAPTAASTSPTSRTRAARC